MKNKRQKAIRKLLSSGWGQLVPGIYVAKEIPRVSSEEAEIIEAKVGKWEAKFEEIDKNSFLVFVESGPELVTESDSAAGVVFHRSNEENLESKDYFMTTGEGIGIESGED